jgi:diaminopropionate ammonia-lyase
MEGYGVMVLELIEQLGTADPPSHVFIQAGVGGLAASVAGILSEHYSKERPTFVVVEPETAACLFESNLRLRPAKIRGDLRTRMAMLSAGEASAAAWPILERRIDAFLAIEDGAALSARAALVAPKNGDPALDVGISGAAGIAGLVQVCGSSRLSRLLGLSPQSRAVVFGTEWGRDDQL